jgi:hypothetical protein
MAQTPLVGILGWPHDDVVAGMPLLLGLGPDTFRAVLARELGHLSAGTAGWAPGGVPGAGHAAE